MEQLSSHIQSLGGDPLLMRRFTVFVWTWIALHSTCRIFVLAFAAAISLLPASVYAAPPELPRVYIDTTMPTQTGRTIAVTAGGNFQTALNTAQPGDTISLEAGATFTGPFTLPEKKGTGWIIIRTSASDASLPPPGTRITAASARVMPKLYTGGSQPAVLTAARAHHYRFIGVEFGVPPSVTQNYNIIRLGNESLRLVDQPHHLIFDRVYIHGHPTLNVQRGIALNSQYTAIIDSYVAEIHWDGIDSQAIAGWTGPGPFKIVNNYLEASGENVLFGGADYTVPETHVPADIELRRNYFVKPLSWKLDDPSYAGRHWTVKNLFEIKNGIRILVDGNRFENCWADAQEGWAIRLINTGVIKDITFTNNIVRYAANGLDICGACRSDAFKVTGRISIINNSFTDIGGRHWTSDLSSGWAFMFRTGITDLTVENNTLLQSGTILVFADPIGSGFVMRNNIALHNEYGVFGGPHIGTNALNTYAPGWIFQNNAIVGLPPSISPSMYPSSNFFPASLSEVGFMNGAAGNYRLAATSPYKKVGTDGKALGVDLDALSAVIAVAPQP